jgi:hypothetical protein
MRFACRLHKKGQYFQQLLMLQQSVGHQGQGGRRHQGFQPHYDKLSAFSRLFGISRFIIKKYSSTLGAHTDFDGGLLAQGLTPSFRAQRRHWRVLTPELPNEWRRRSSAQGSHSAFSCCLHLICQHCEFLDGSSRISIVIHKPIPKPHRSQIAPKVAIQACRRKSARVGYVDTRRPVSPCPAKALVFVEFPGRAWFPFLASNVDRSP